VLSVGLAPGLTNLLVSHLQSQFDQLHQTDIYILLGLGEPHGAAAARWTVQNLNATYTVRENGQPRQVTSFGEQRVAHFPAALGQRSVYRFNIADQHVLTRTFGLNSVSTWITFDPVAVTKMMAFMRRTRLSALLRYKWVEELVVRSSTAIQYGTETFAIQVTAQGMQAANSQTQTAAIVGKGQGRTTGLVTAPTVTHLLTHELSAGVFHSEQLLEPAPFIKKLTLNGITFYENSGS
ncbi:MAG: hypothetical protein KDE51_08820, partial [Anaerolineales bacterium]|nr:hypothetical protein [Anaerolineales bacterium]